MPVIPLSALIRGCVASALSLMLFWCGAALGGEPNRLLRMELKALDGRTRITFVFAGPQRHKTLFQPGRGVRLTFPETTGPMLKKHASYSDDRISRVRTADRGDRLLVELSFREGTPGIRLLDDTAPNVLILEVGSLPRLRGAEAMPDGREYIWNGAAKLVREFSPPQKSELPFFPTPGILIRKLVPAGELKNFLRGEDALFHERGAEAEEVFTGFLNGEPSVRAIASYRLGESQYLLQKYESALRWFREGERLWPEFMVESPSIAYSYADTLARCGETEAGRKMFERLIVGMADTKYGPLLLVRRGDILARGGREMDALAVYRNVATGFAGARASLLASIRIADRSLFSVSGHEYRALAAEYRRIYSLSGEAGLKEEALFKWALMEALYGTVAEAARAVSEYEKTFPMGVFANVAKNMREELLVSLFRELDSAGDCVGIVKLALDNRGYLARCVGESRFIPRVSECLMKQGMLSEELVLFSSLVETEWVGENSRFLYRRIIEDAWTLGDLPIAEAASKVFLSRFPGDEQASRVRDRLGRLQFRNGDMAAVIATLSPLLGRKRTPVDPESYYFLGKACESLRDMKRAQASLELFLKSIGDRADSTLAADARMILAEGKLAGNDRKGAMAEYRKGLETSSGERREMFLYKIGEVELLEGRREAARACWERIVAEGRDPVWKSMAIQALADLSWSAFWERDNGSK